jgi:hypothetical protein
VPGTAREQSYIGGTLQRGLLGKFAGYWIAYTCLLWVGMFLLDVYVFHITVAKGGGLGLLWELYVRFCRQNVHLLVSIVLISPVLFLNVFWLTHRVAGPLERFCIALERLEKGEEVEPLTLRRDDLLVDYQYAFNRYLASLKSAQERDRDQVVKCRASASPASFEAEPVRVQF